MPKDTYKQEHFEWNFVFCATERIFGALHFHFQAVTRSNKKKIIEMVFHGLYIYEVSEIEREREREETTNQKPICSCVWLEGKFTLDTISQIRFNKQR